MPAVGLAVGGEQRAVPVQAEEDRLGPRRHQQQPPVLDPQATLGQHERAGLGAGSLLRPARRRHGARWALAPVRLLRTQAPPAGYVTAAAVESGPPRYRHRASCRYPTICRGTVQMGARTRSTARGRGGGTLRGRLLFAALASIAPLLVGAGLWITMLSNSATEYRQLASGAGARVRLERAPAATLERRRGRGHRLHAERSRRRPAGLPGGRREGRPRAAGTGGYDESAEVIAFIVDQQPVEARQAAGSRVPAATAGVDEGVRGRHARGRRGLERLMTESQGEVAQDLAASDARRPPELAARAGGGGRGGAARGLLASRLSRSLARPLEQLARAAHSLACGHLGHRVAINSTTEMNEVGGTFNTMAAALEEQHEELERHAFSDSLTGLANRALFEDRTRHALERLDGRPERVAVLVLDLDGFKLINDALGHACGDALLRQAAERMANTMQALGHAGPAGLGRVRGAARERARAGRRVGGGRAPAGGLPGPVHAEGVGACS